MEYSNEFKDLIARIEQTKDFIGYGNPNAKILIIGKEEALDIEEECDKEIMKFIKSNGNVEKNRFFASSLHQSQFLYGKIVKILTLYTHGKVMNCLMAHGKIIKN
jgi:chromosome condensin MukBEF complex kleisin-like MukF subunit